MYIIDNHINAGVQTMLVPPLKRISNLSIFNKLEIFFIYTHKFGHVLVALSESVWI